VLFKKFELVRFSIVAFITLIYKTNENENSGNNTGIATKGQAFKG